MNSDTDSLSISYDNGIGVVSAVRPIQGEGVAPALLNISDPLTFDYGDQSTGSVTRKTFTVTHSGSVDANLVFSSPLTLPFKYNGSGYPGTGGNCGASILIGDTCTIVVNFEPTATGVATDTINLNYDNGVSPQVSSRPLTGNGVTPANLSISDTAVSYTHLTLPTILLV